MVEIGAQRLLANGWTTYSLGNCESVRNLLQQAKEKHNLTSDEQNEIIQHTPDGQKGVTQITSIGQKETTQLTTDGQLSNDGNNRSSSSTTTTCGSLLATGTPDNSDTSGAPISTTNGALYSHCGISDQYVDNMLKYDGFVPRVLQRYFELTAGTSRDSVVNRSSAICSHAAGHNTCQVDNLYPLYCVVLIHLLPGAGPLVYPRHRLGRSLSVSRESMLATNWQSADLPASALQELRERFGFIPQKAPSELLAEMDGPGWRGIGDVTIIASDMLYSLPSGANLAQSVPKRHIERAMNTSILPHTKKRKSHTHDAGDHNENEGQTPAHSKASTEKVNGASSVDSLISESTYSDSSPAVSSSSAPVSSAPTLYVYSIYQPKAEASLPPTYILNSESTNKIRFDPPVLHKILSGETNSGNSQAPLHPGWNAFNLPDDSETNNENVQPLT
mgnify:CR=1 FL=1